MAEGWLHQAAAARPFNWPVCRPPVHLTVDMIQVGLAVTQDAVANIAVVACLLAERHGHRNHLRAGSEW
jgi:hypothetical protein